MSKKEMSDNITFIAALEMLERLESQNFLTSAEVERTKTELKRRLRPTLMEKGIFLSSSVPYGYRLQGRDMEIIPEEAAVAKDIFAAYLAGRGRADISKELNHQSIPRNNKQKKWHPSIWRSLLGRTVWITMRRSRR